MTATRDEYTATAKLLHWLIAAFVIGLIGLGLYMTRVENLQFRFELYQLHKSMGITVLALMVLRVAWRIFVPPPRLPTQLPGWEKNAAHGTHFGLYALLLVMPLSGWAMVSAAQPPFNFPTVLYNLIPWPHIPVIEELSAEQKKTVEPLLKNLHSALGWALLALVCLHIAAGLRHSFILKDGVMLRMVPRFLKSSRHLVLPFSVLFVLAAVAFPASAQQWALNKDKSKVSFEVDAGGQAVIGEFEQFDASIRFDPSNPGQAEISVRIDMNTVTTGQSQVDDALLTKDWFDVQTYPAAGFRATSIEAGDSEGSYTMVGDLTIKGNTKPVTIPFSLDVDLGEATVKGETAINRQNFAIGPDGPISGITVGDLIKIRLDISATRLDN